jgi:CubicO group peptidase (beta-lactamase class C family)
MYQATSINSVRWYDAVVRLLEDLMKALLGAFALAVSAHPLWAGDARVSPTSRISDDIGQLVDQCVQTAITDHDLIGVAVAVVLEGELAYENGYGRKHRDQPDLVDAHTRFQHGSVGKMMTAAAVMRLVDQGLVDLDDSVTEYVPELQFAPGRWTAEQITVRDLINNSAAIPSFRTATTASLSEWAETLVDVPLLAEPGAFFNYSNSNFALAGLVVERASGMSFMDYLDAEVFAVAGMTESSAYPDVAMASGNFSYGHSDDGQIWAPDDRSYPIEVASGSAFSSAHDLALWAQHMLAGCGYVMGHGSCLEVQRSQMPRLYSQTGWPHSIDGGFYGFGLFIDEYPDVVRIRHDGGVPGWVGSLSWLPSRGAVVALLANKWPSGFDGLRDASMCLYQSLLGVTMPDMSEPSDPVTWKGCAGRYPSVYEDGYEFEAVVEWQNDDLMITVPHPENPDESITRELENVAGTSFLLWVNPQSYWGITFIEGEGIPGPIRWLRNPWFAGQRQMENRSPSGRVEP